MPDWIVLVGSVFGLAGVIASIREVIVGKASPNLITYAIWALAPFVAVAASLASGVTWAVWPTFMSGVGPFLVLSASFVSKKAYWKLELFDWACGTLSVLALVLWYLTKNPNIAILFAILSDGLAALPTLKKGWFHPETETIWIFVGGMVTPILGLIVAKDSSFAQIGFPLYLVTICFILVLIIQTGKWRRCVLPSRSSV